MKDVSQATSVLDRRGFVKATGVGLAALAAGAGRAAVAASTPPASSADTPDAAFELLKSGNARFAAGKSQCPPLTARRLEVAEGQNPFAIVLGCSDSRVPLDTVFDTVPGHIFGVRVAGNFLDANGMGSIEYGVAALAAPLILVLGHSSCGAVAATIKFLKTGVLQPGHIQDLIIAIEPAAKAVKNDPGDWTKNAIARNVKVNADAMTTRSTIIAEAVSKGRVRVVGGVYDLHTGVVGFI